MGPALPPASALVPAPAAAPAAKAALLDRVKKRAAESGDNVRSDDNADALKKRLDVYRAQTAPLAEFYSRKGLLKQVNGMAPIEEVSAEIERIFADVGR